MTIYYCVFLLRGEELTVRHTYGIQMFIDGFWINKDHEFTQGSDCKYWIPPSKIQYITLERVDNG